MSLKAFHLFFIAVSTLMMAVVAVWAAQQYFALGGGTHLFLALVGGAGAVVLPIYGTWFLKKTKKVSLV